jgi:hypothetical protein
MEVEDIQRIALATAQFLDFVDEVSDEMYQGYDFIDYTLLCVHRDAFSKLTENEAVELVKAIGFTVLPANTFKEIDEPTFSLKILCNEEDLKNKVKNFIEKEL